MKNKRVRKNKRRVLNSLIILITAGVIAFSPVIAVSTPAHALPDLPSTPDLPDSPDEPESPDTPDLPGEEEEQPQAETDNNSESPNEEVIADQEDTNNEQQTNTETTEQEPEQNNEQSQDSNTGTTNNNDGNVAEQDASLSNLGTNEDPNNEISLADLEASNSNTGADSENEANSEVDNSLDLSIDNDFDADNSAYINMDTGDNSADRNTGDGEVVSGDADIVLTALNVGNDVNVGTQVFNVFDDQTGDLIIDFNDVTGLPLGGSCGDSNASNDTTGSDSDNDASTVCTTQNTILIDNDGNIVNDYYISADTGNNTADKNTGDGSVTTGDANVVLNVINFLNNTFLGGSGELLLGMVNIFGNLSGDIVLNMPDSGDDFFLAGADANAGNSNTGADSENNASTSTNNETDISLTNSADIFNNIMLFADTGNNDASKNTGSGSITTGDVNSNLNVTNVSNTNVIGDGGTLWMVLINNLGNWEGQIWGFDDTGVASPFFTFAIGDDGAFNAETGADSTNNASTETNNDTDITVNNDANLTNNIYINANTGGNSTSMNTGSGSISTGDVNIAANIVNMVNNNFLAGTFVLTIVNVFGSFLGDVFPGGTEQQESVLADENTSLAIEANGKTTLGIQNNTGGQNNIGVAGFNSSGGSKTEAETSKGGIVSNLTNSVTNAKVESATKIIGKDSTRVTDYWWIIIPLLLAVGSAVFKRRFS